ncbi:hypothetical protein B9Z07_23180 [Burkholderia cenocepacia]|uniref:Uncharacterized protein n=1 Tax=Burkholderia cenocepacia TaxID=95486 RepID=A0AAD0NE04_9BURK|nr:hypothetical protein B9Z07_23180 [Burkholderia cenocepacia]PRE34422.1 hypothetical protein C6P63_23895 [Burkholderia cenocepacia]
MERRGRSAGYLSGAGAAVARRCGISGTRVAAGYPNPRPSHCPTRTPGRQCPILSAAPDAGTAPRDPPSATRFRPPPRRRKVAHACRITPIRENTDPRTTGNP